MLTFKHYLSLYEDDTSPADPKVKEKLKHLEHIEDLIINRGQAGAQAALQFMHRLLTAASGGKNERLLTNVKIDGAPSIVAGLIPAGEKGAGQFFVGTKSALSPNGKRYTKRNVGMIDQENSPGLAHKLKVALRFLPEIGLNAVYQGDFLFTKDEVKPANVEGADYLIFKPNVITYAVPVDSKAGHEVAQAQMGVVFHTVYEGDTWVDMHATYNPDLSQLKHTPNVWWKSNRVQEDKALPHAKEDISAVKRELDQADKLLKKIDPRFLATLRDDPKMGELIKLHMNSKVRQGQLVQDVGKHIQEFGVFVKDRFAKDMEKLKSAAGQDKVRVQQTTYLNAIAKTQHELAKLFTFFNHITNAKVAMLGKVGGLEGMSAFYQEDGKYRKTSGEGLVLADAKSNDVVKLVDRLDFSRINFTQPKDWAK